MIKIALAIKEDYQKFKSIVFDKKSTSVNPITFTKDKPSRPDKLYHTSDVKHIYRTESIIFIAEQDKKDMCCYKFQIRCKEFYEKPLFRFDSSGSSHQNKDLPLAKQQITTPHFNSFDENGRPIAYKTSELEILDHNKLKDIAKFFEIFCNECQLFVDDDSLPSIQSGDVRILNFNLHNEDLLSDINFEL